MSETAKPGISAAIAASVAQLKAAMHTAGRYAQGERGRRLAIGWNPPATTTMGYAEVDEAPSIPACKERRLGKATADLEAVGWRFLPAPRFVKRAGRSLAPVLEWGTPRWAVIPPEGSNAVARTFDRKGEAIAWARSAMIGAGGKCAA
jgi:hypothetical protein